MGIFIDTGIFVAFHNKLDETHGRAINLITEVLQGKHGTAFTSDFVFDEAVTLALFRTKFRETARDVGDMIIGNPKKKLPTFVKLVNVDPEIFKQAWTIFNKYDEKTLSFTDCTSIALIEQLKINSIMSFDRDFDGIVERVS
ncbi:MAG: PIN domain-containing protein [Candidatus Hydrothermarchaeaceae archaeon]